MRVIEVLTVSPTLLARYACAKGVLFYSNKDSELFIKDHIEAVTHGQFPRGSYKFRGESIKFLYSLLQNPFFFLTEEGKHKCLNMRSKFPSVEHHKKRLQESTYLARKATTVETRRYR